jgi:hypothetical protein
MCKEVFEEIAESLTMIAMAEARKKGYTNEMIAYKVGKSVSAAEKWSSAVRTPTLKQFIGLIVALKLKEPVKELAKMVGLVAVEPPPACDVAHYPVILKETAEAIECLSRAIEDEVITKEEAREVIKEAEEAVAAWLAQIHRCKEILKEGKR